MCVVELIPSSVVTVQSVILLYPSSIQVRHPLLSERGDVLDITCGDQWNHEAETTTRESHLQGFRTYVHTYDEFLGTLRKYTD
jgi:hypothetical protein